MRTLGVMSKNTRTGKWHLVNRLQTLPAGFYISPTYSTLLEGSGKSRAKSTYKSFSSRDGQDTVNLPGNGLTDIYFYFIEFDEEGRMSQPNAPTRLVVVSGSAGDGKEERPSPMTDGKPGLAGGIVIYPKGNISRLRTDEQVIPNNFTGFYYHVDQSYETGSFQRVYPDRGGACHRRGRGADRGVYGHVHPGQENGPGRPDHS